MEHLQGLRSLYIWAEWISSFIWAMDTNITIQI